MASVFRNERAVALWSELEDDDLYSQLRSKYRGRKIELEAEQ